MVTGRKGKFGVYANDMGIQVDQCGLTIILLLRHSEIIDFVFRGFGNMRETSC